MTNESIRTSGGVVYIQSKNATASGAETRKSSYKEANETKGMSDKNIKDLLLTNKEFKEYTPDGPAFIGLHPAIIHPQFVDEEVNREYRTMLLSKTPFIEIIPAYPEFGSSEGGGGLQLLSLNVSKGREEWKKILKSIKKILKDALGNEDPTKYLSPSKLVIAALPETIQINEGFANAYGQTIFESLMNVESTLGANLSRITGLRGIEDINKVVGEDIRTKVNERISNIIENYFPKVKENALANQIKTLANTALKLLLGARIDYPSIWQGSSASLQYQFTTRLYVLTTNDLTEYVLRIVLPLAYILSLTLPISLAAGKDSKSADAYTFTYPLMVKARAGGLFYVPAGVISNVQINKGGDNLAEVGYHMQAGTIDVTITIESIYDTMIAFRTEEEDFEDVQPDRPTLNKYISNLVDWVEFGPLTPEQEKTEEEKEEAKKAIPTKKDKLQSIKNTLKNIKNLPEKLFENASKIAFKINSLVTGISTKIMSFNTEIKTQLSYINGISTLPRETFNNITGNFENTKNQFLSTKDEISRSMNAISSIFHFKGDEASVNKANEITNKYLKILNFISTAETTLYTIQNIIQTGNDIQEAIRRLKTDYAASLIDIINLLTSILTDLNSLRNATNQL